jgi:ABC-2 type transport system ATP-binding protein
LHAGLRLDRVTKRYGEKTIADHLCLSVETGTVAGLVGLKGCGKTTILGMIAGLEKADEGRILVAGHDIAAAPVEVKRNLAFVPDKMDGFAQLTVLEYLDLYRSLHRKPRASFDRCTRLLLEAFGLTKHLRSVLGELSQGTRRKVEIVFASALGTNVLMIDEPTAGMDPEGAVALRSLLKHASRAGSTILLATQDLAFAERVCDRLFLVNEGRLLAIGSPASLLDLYGTDGVEDLFLSAADVEKRTGVSGAG